MDGLFYLLQCLLIANVFANKFTDPHTSPDRRVMVQLFEWKWTDIAKECENFLWKYGYGAVQVSPPNEHITLKLEGGTPWWVRYQPVSYQFASRSGTNDEFVDMIKRCNKVGVRIIVDAVINNMVGLGQVKGEKDVGSSGNSSFDATEAKMDFPQVPYTKSEFNKCAMNISVDSEGKPEDLRDCRLNGWLDLNQGDPNVQDRIINYLNSLTGAGVAGFRVGTSRYMWPKDLEVIQERLSTLNDDIFGHSKYPFFVHEVSDQDNIIDYSDYKHLGRYVNTSFGSEITTAVKKELFQNLKNLDINHTGDDTVVFIDSHETQRKDALSYKNDEEYKTAVAFMLAWPYGFPRIMSSYFFDTYDQGPPDRQIYETKFNNDSTCSKDSGWVCEHRWPVIRNMVKFRSMVQGVEHDVNTTDYNRIAITYKGKGFFAINGNDWVWWTDFNTTLPGGEYCDLWTGSLVNGDCTGEKIVVRPDGMSDIEIDRIVAISEASRIDYVDPTTTTKPTTTTRTTTTTTTTTTTKTTTPTTTTTTTPTTTTTTTKTTTPTTTTTTTPTTTTTTTKTTTPTTTTTTTPSQWKRTVLMLKKETKVGEYVFFRGGTDHMHKKNCPSTPQDRRTPCAIPIRHTNMTFAPHYEIDWYYPWSSGDKYLDWVAAEWGQGTHMGRKSYGTPSVYSDKNPSAKEYHIYNKYGRAFWMVVLNMDCAQTENEWFEVKGFLTYGNAGNWENDIKQGTCGGTIGGAAPFQSINHIARCGAQNVFYWGSNGCIIDDVPSYEP